MRKVCAQTEKKWEAQKAGARWEGGGGGLDGGKPNISRFFSLSRPTFRSLFSFWVSSSFHCGRGSQGARFGFSGPFVRAPAACRPLGRALNRGHNSTKKTPREEKTERHLRREREKKSEILGGVAEEWSIGGGPAEEMKKITLKKARNILKLNKHCAKTKNMKKSQKVGKNQKISKNEK